MPRRMPPGPAEGSVLALVVAAGPPLPPAQATAQADQQSLDAASTSLWKADACEFTLTKHSHA